ncbi:BTAD domain-containing putative transcriptional regulator [Streptomyces sp. NPDC086077]|uniref:AfsR/SARP family transcriptional regulator n=1 Tax=Streptomyces sp. NPDC086077 TaxID=3154862 RepID=UPI003446FCEC
MDGPDRRDGDSTEFRLLGQVELRSAGQVVGLGPPQRHLLLAALLVDADRAVTLETLIDRVWGEEVPAQARASLYSHAARIRRTLEHAAVHGPDERAGRPRLLRTAAGYRLAVAPALVDMHRCRRLVEAARGKDRDERLALLREAFSLWRGEPLAGLPGQWAAHTREMLRQQRVDVAITWAQAELAMGGSAAVIAALPRLLGEHPLVEPLAGLLMRALNAAGRRAEALACYATLRQRLSDDLGTDPSAELQQVHEEILRRRATGPTASRPPCGTAESAWAAPAQLPLPTQRFTGRTTEIAALDEVLADHVDRPNSAAVSVLSGTAGVGKTALAVSWAHRVAHHFPDGQLFVNMQGFDMSGEAVSPRQAIQGLLEALGVPGERVPADFDAQVNLYRSRLAGRRVLVVLDNARDVRQVRPLLPGSPGCLTVVTSRNQLFGLVAVEGAHTLTLDLLSHGEARTLLTHRLGAERLAAEPEAVREIVDRCARLPLALAVVAARAAMEPRLRLAWLAGELRAADGGLDAFTGDADDPPTDVRAVFSWSYDALSPGAARAFALLGLHPGPDVSLHATASLTGHTATRARHLLAELSRAHLITSHTPGRYTLHDLLRSYATEKFHCLDPRTEQDPALHRMLDHYVHSAHAADHQLAPHRDPIVLSPPSPQTVAEQSADHEEAATWFTTEHRVLLALVRRAADTAMHHHAWHLAWGLTTYLQRRGRGHELLAVQHTALQAARCLPNAVGEAHAHRGLGIAYRCLDRPDDSAASLLTALDLFRELADPVGQAHCHLGVVWALSRQGRHDEAGDHLRAALVQFQMGGDRSGQARVLNNFAWYHAEQGDRRALSLCRQALDLLRDSADREGQAAVWDTFGYTHHHLGRPVEAIRCYRQALRLYEQLGHRFHEAEVLTHLGHAHLAADERQKARDSWQRALAALDEMGHPEADHIRTGLRQLDETAPLDVGQLAVRS